MDRLKHVQNIVNSSGGGGGHLYVHDIKIRLTSSGDNYYLTTRIISKNNEQFTRNSFVEYLNNNYKYSNGYALPASGWYGYPDLRPVNGLAYGNNEIVYISSVYVKGDGTIAKNSGAYSLKIVEIQDVADKIIEI